MKTTKLVTTSLLFVIVFTTGVVFSRNSEDYKSKIEKLNKVMAQNMIQGNTEKKPEYVYQGCHFNAKL